MKNSHRQFMILSAAGACTLALNSKVQAQAMVAEVDPHTATLGYKATLLVNNLTTVFYQGNAASASGGCSFFWY
jgi:hypothetical protein